MPSLDLNGASLYYETDGAIGSPAVLLIHAGIATLRMWDAQAEALAQHHFVIRFDTRGFGLTEADDDVPFSNRLDAIDLLDHLGIETATIVGASRGGSIALDIALEFADRVRAVATIGSGPSGFPEVDLTDAEEELFEAMDVAYDEGDSERLNRLEVELWDFGPTRAASDLDPDFVRLAYELNAVNLPHAEEEPEPIPLDPPAYERVGDIRVPALVMVGDRDISPALLQHEYLLRGIPFAEGHVFEGAAHIPSVEQPAEFSRVLLDWMSRKNL
jgi:3-oxoadipate enol-lactonase